MKQNLEENTMFVLCSYCKKYMDLIDGKGQNRVSHSICPECMETHFQKNKCVEEKIKEF